MAIPAHHKVIAAPPPEVPAFAPDLLAGQVAAITGGGSGMGLAMATEMGRAGAAIAIFGRTQEKAEEGAALLRAMGVRVLALGGDVRDPASLAENFDRAEAELGPVTILGNNAGGNYPVLSEAMSPGQWRSITRIAIDGSFLASAEFARRRIAAGGGGAIINNSAQYVWSGFPGDAHSAAAKAAMVTMSASLAAEWKPHGIRVNCIAAGYFPHAGSTSGSSAKRDYAQMGSTVPAGRVGQMHEFGRLATFLASSCGAGISGETLVIDGGDRLRRELFERVYVPPRERAEIWNSAS